MKTKIIPFDLETAKKIQSGDVEGRIISSKGYPVRIICYDYRNLKKEYHILFAIEYSSHEGIFSCDDEGRVDMNNFRLYIEVPEEAPKQNFKTIEESDAYAYGYTNCYRAGMYEQKQKLGDIVGDALKKSGELIMEIATLKEQMREQPPKHEFKPFDKVLVRMSDEEVWKVSLYGFKRDDGTHCCINTSCWEQCIPYEGNEHLIGTTDKPKED